MRVFIVKSSGYTNEVETDVEKAYTALARNHASVEVNSRVNRQRQHGSVAAYTPTGNHCRVWGAALIKNTPFNLWKEYTRLFARVGIKPTRAAWAAYLDVLEEYNSSSKTERWVVFFKEQYPDSGQKPFCPFFQLLYVYMKTQNKICYI